MASLQLDRAAWLGHRWRRHGLAGPAGKDLLDDLLLLGVQGSRLGGAEQALGQRTRKIGSTGVARAIRPGGPLVSAWTVRGAPHAHRPERLDLLRDALAPVDADEGGPGHVAAVAEIAAALAAVVTGPTTKGDASAEITRRLPERALWCSSCGIDHVPDGLFRAAGRQAGLVLGAEKDRATVLLPGPGKRQRTAADPRRALLDAYVRVNGPTSRTLFRDWSGLGQGSVGELWAGADLVKVSVEGRRWELPEALVDEVRGAAPAEGVALVPPNDPYLRQVDRTLLVPDRGRRSQVYRPVSGPGALLVDGEVAGTWRLRAGTLTISPFGGCPAAERPAAESAAARLAESTAAGPPTVEWD